MAIKINADTSNGLKLTSDTSGVIEFQSAGTTKAGVNGTGLTGNGSQITALTSGNLTGALPAIDGSALTGISSIPSKVAKTFELSSSGAVTAGRGVSVSLIDGKVGLLPTLNSIGTVANEGGLVRTARSIDGSKGLNWVYSGTTSSRIITYTGNFISGANPPTNGTGSTTVTNRAIHNTGAWNYDTMWAIPIDNDRFMISTTTFMSDHVGAQNGYIKTDSFVITVDDSGNLTKGNVLTSDGSATSQWASYRKISLGTLGSPNANSSIAFFAFAREAQEPGQPVWGQIKKVFKVDGTTLSQIDDSGGESVKQYTNHDANQNTKGQATQLNQSTNNFSMRIGSKILRSNPTYTTTNKGNNWVGVSDFNTSTGQVGGTVTYQEVVTPAGDNITGTVTGWTVMDNTHVMCSFADASGLGNRYNTYSINTSGVLTKVYSYLANPLVQRFDLNNTVFPNNSIAAAVQVAAVQNIQTKTNTMSLSATGEILGYNVGLAAPVGTNWVERIYYRDGNWIVTYNDNGVKKVMRFIVNAAITGAYTYIGFASATSSSGNQSITVAGVATGFSGLTIGAYYWTNSTFTGEVTKLNNSGNFVGTAVSATEILLNRREVP